MKFRYEFNNGDVEEIEVTGEWYDTLVSLDAEEKRNERRETRRHISLEWHNREEGEDFDSPHFIDPRADVPAEALRRVDIEKLAEALTSLSSRQQELVHRVFYLGERISDIAAEEGVDKSAIAHRIERIQKNLKKFLE